jgi:hypothetical protein
VESPGDAPQIEAAVDGLRAGLGPAAVDVDGAVDRLDFRRGRGRQLELVLDLGQPAAAEQEGEQVLVPQRDGFDPDDRPRLRDADDRVLERGGRRVR